MKIKRCIIDCGALGTLASVELNDAVKSWNEGYVMQYICEEQALEVE